MSIWAFSPFGWLVFSCPLFLSFCSTASFLVPSASTFESGFVNLETLLSFHDVLLLQIPSRPVLVGWFFALYIHHY